MSVLVFFSENPENTFGFSNSIFGGIHEFAREQGISVPLEDLLDNASLFHWCPLYEASTDDLKRFAAIIEMLIEHIANVDSNYVRHLQDFLDMFFLSFSAT